MKPKNRASLISLENTMSDIRMSLQKMKIQFRSSRKSLSAEFSEVVAAIDSCQKSHEHLLEQVNLVFSADDKQITWPSEIPFTEVETNQLMGLNRHLAELTRQLRLVSIEISQRMKAKIADPDDPMYDYEIEAHLAYVLREDDPEFDEDDDNYLTERVEYLTIIEEDKDMDFSESHLPESLRKEPHCWLFHDLHDHSYGVKSPRLGFRECLRIGKIHVDVHVQQQYVIDVL